MTVKFGLIGTGYWAAAVHAPGLAAHSETELVGVWGRDRAKAAALAARFGAQPFSDVDELIGAVDGVAFRFRRTSRPNWPYAPLDQGDRCCSRSRSR